MDDVVDTLPSLGPVDDVVDTLPSLGPVDDVVDTLPSLDPVDDIVEEIDKTLPGAGDLLPGGTGKLLDGDTPDLGL